MPTASEDGSTDPYVVVQFRGKTIRSRKVLQTTSPRWYKTLKFKQDMKLPQTNLDLAPPVIVQVYDWDRWALSDNRLGVADLDITDAKTCQVLTTAADISKPVITPHWIPLREFGGDEKRGEILLSLQLVPHEEGASAEV